MVTRRVIGKPNRKRSPPCLIHYHPKYILTPKYAKTVAREYSALNTLFALNDGTPVVSKELLARPVPISYFGDKYFPFIFTRQFNTVHLILVIV